MVLRPQLLCGALLFLMIAPTPGAADPVQLPAFKAVVYASPNWPTGPVVFELTAPAFLVSGETAREMQPGGLLSPCYPGLCTPGTTVDFSRTTPVLGSAYIWEGELTMNDQVFHIVGLHAVLAVSGPAAHIPPLTNGVAEVRVPVSVTASLVAFLVRDYAEEPWPLALRLSGRGTAHMILRRPPPHPGDEFSEMWVDDVTLEFSGGEAPAPVPEPATLLLMATGAAVIGRRVWNTTGRARS